jgi:hypothetical protein
MYTFKDEFKEFQRLYVKHTCEFREDQIRTCFNLFNHRNNNNEIIQFKYIKRGSGVTYSIFHDELFKNRKS